MNATIEEMNEKMDARDEKINEWKQWTQKLTSKKMT